MVQNGLDLQNTLDELPRSTVPAAMVGVSRNDAVTAQQALIATHKSVLCEVPTLMTSDTRRDSVSTAKMMPRCWLTYNVAPEREATATMAPLPGLLSPPAPGCYLSFRDSIANAI